GAAVEVDYHGDKYDAVVSGSLVLTGLKADVEMRVNVGIISGISIRSCTIGMRAPRIESTQSRLKSF
ncbi:jg20947, partial [Pararge aegeria aegeria]